MSTGTVASGRFEGKVALVTGAASGMGFAVAERLGAEGASVVGVDRDLRGHDDETNDGDGVLWLRGDVTREDEVRAAVAATLDAYGTVDVLVNAAGIVTGGELVEDTPLEGWRRVIETNLTGSFLCIKHVVPHFKQQGSGAIVNFASTSALRPSQLGTGAYTASKGAIAALTRQLVLELSPSGVRVNAVAPGPVWTPLTAVYGEGWAEEKARVIPRGALGTPEEVAGVVAFLASDDARNVTGQVVVADGGMTAVIRS